MQGLLTIVGPTPNSKIGWKGGCIMQDWKAMAKPVVKTYLFWFNVWNTLGLIILIAAVIILLFAGPKLFSTIKEVFYL